MWQPPSLTLRWGPYFRAAPEDEQKLVDLVAQARDAGLITRRSSEIRKSRWAKNSASSRTFPMSRGLLLYVYRLANGGEKIEYPMLAAGRPFNTSTQSP
jgi:hypothetical protein